MGRPRIMDPYLIQSFSTVGVLAQSVTNSATANLIALNGNPASVGATNAPDIGVAANVFAGAANATVNVDGTNGGATVNANNTGLYAAVSIFGTGNAIINQTNCDNHRCGCCSGDGSQSRQQCHQSTTTRMPC